MSLDNSIAAERDWPVVGGDKGCLRYSSLNQINRRNASQLQVAWSYHTGDAGKATTIECKDASGAVVGSATNSNDLTTDDVKTNQSSLTCTITFTDP